MNGILAVGQGSINPPRFILMEHNAGKKNLPTIVFIGKGITFDTGGICIKPAPGMEDMKMDMSGAASVVGAMYAVAQLDLPVHVVGMIASAENMPGGRAVKPGDVYTAHSGATVEVINTDAEGRLVLSDALSYAKEYKPDCVIDIATLTGAVIVALGYTSSGIMGNDGELLEGFRRTSEKVGEKVWELPLYAEYIDDMKSKCADYRNSGDRAAGSQKGGTFLNFFVDGAYPWVHVDIAGTDVPKGQGAHCPPDVGSGVPVRALVEFARNYKSYFKGAPKKKG
jgi:leucyl aminopeptidase